MNILLVHCHYKLPGGEDAVFAAEAAMLAAHGHKVVLYERSNDEAAGAKKLLLPLRAIYSLKAAREVRRLIRKNHIDLVHVHNTLLEISPSVFGAAAGTGVPVVQTLHNFRIFCPGGVLLRDGNVCEDCPHASLLCAVRHRCYRGSALQSAVCAAIYGLHRLLGTYRGVNLITLTEFDRSKLLEFNALKPVFDPDRLYVKPNSVALCALPFALPLPWQQRKNQIVFAGRLEELKGLRSVLEAWQKLKGEDGAPKLIVCGSGPLEGWAREAARGCSVEFLGTVKRQTLQQLMAESRAVIAASLCYETFALVPAEAHALGTPVLASNIGNVGASVQNGVDGLLFAPGDAGDICRAVRALPALGAAADLAEISRKTLEKYSPEENYQRLMAIYRDIL